MTEVLQILHAGALGILFVGAAVGSGAPAARWLGLGDALALPLGFGCTALAGIVAFCAWWISPAAGGAVSLALTLGGVALLGAQVAEPRRRDALRVSLPPALAMLLLGAAWLCLLHAGGVPASARFTHALPADDQLPRLFADRLATARLSGPLYNEWLMSDRPPLQCGVLLLFRPLGAAAGLPAAAIATLCQLMWLPALVALGRALRFNSRAIAAGVLFSATSGFFLLNTIYTWPKLMAAALLITAVAAVLAGARSQGANAGRTAAAAGALLSLAALAHGGAWFSILALPALPVAWSALRWFGMRGVAVLALVFAFVAAPWFAFKQLVDPPGNRLEKWHLAGVVPADDRSTLEAIRDSYSKAPAGNLLRARMVNIQFVAGFYGRNPNERWGEYIRRLQFFHFMPAVGLPLLGAVWLVVRRLRGGPDGGAAGLVAHSAATVAIWVALTFQPGGSIVHAGSYAPLALLIFLGAAAFAGWPAAIGVTLLALHSALFVSAWVVSTPVSAAGSVLPSSPWLLAVSAIAFAGFAVCLWKLPPDPAD